MLIPFSTSSEQEIIVIKNIFDAKNLVTESLLKLKGKIIVNAQNRIECDFGSHLKSKLLGELFVSGSTLPKKAVAVFVETGDDNTRVSIIVSETHKFGFKAGFAKKYQLSLNELADSIHGNISGT